MSVFNAGSRFSEKKKLSVPVIRVPKKVRQALNIAEAREDGIFKIEPQVNNAVYDQCYIFEDVNYINQDMDKKGDILLNLMNFFKSMNCQYKITIANQKKSIEQVIDEVYRPLHGDEYGEINTGVGQWISQKAGEGVRNVEKILYLTVTCRASGYDEARQHFATLDTTLFMVFSVLKSRLYKLSGRERLGVLQKILRQETGLVPPCAGIKNDDWKNAVMPASIEQFKDYLILGNTYASVMFAHDYDQSLNDEKTLQCMMKMPYPVYVTMDMEPVSKRVLKEKLHNALVNNDRVIAQERSRNLSLGQIAAGVSYNLEKKDSEIKDLLDQVDDNDEQSVFMGLLVMVCADTLEELAKRVDTLKGTARTNGYFLDTYNFRQLKAMNTVLPIGGRQVNHMRSLLTSSAVAFNPLHAKDLLMPGGVVYGLNRTTKHLISINRKKLSNPHAMIIGHTGSGKSFFVKETEVAQTLLFTDDDVFILDPQNEFEYVIRESGGQYFDFTPQSDIHLNPFEVPAAVAAGDDVQKNMFVADKTEFAIAFCTAVMSNITVTQIHNTYIDRAVRRTYEKFFASRKRVQPTLRNVWDELKAQETEIQEFERRILNDIIISLEQYVDGVYDMFSKPSNMDIHNRFVGFGLKNVPESIWEPVMITLMHFLKERISYNQQELVCTHLIVDETQVMCKHKTSADQLLKAVETYRKFGGVINLVIQNLTRALENKELRDMFSNCALKVFFDQGGVDAQSLASIQELSATEFYSLQENIPGHGLIVCEKEVMMFDCSMDKDNCLYTPFSTNFHEKSEAMKERLMLEQAVHEEDRTQLLGFDKKSLDALTNMLCMGAMYVENVMELLKMDYAEVEYLVKVSGGRIRMALEDGRMVVRLNGGGQDEDQ